MTEHRTINRYMLRWRAQFPDDSPEAYAEREAERRAEQDAENAEWLRQNATTAKRAPGTKRGRKVIPMPTFKQWEGSGQ